MPASQDGITTTILVHYDEDDPPGIIDDLHAAVQEVDRFVDALRIATQDSPLAVDVLERLVEQLSSKAMQVEYVALELVSAARNAEGLNVTTAAA